MNGGNKEKTFKPVVITNEDLKKNYSHDLSKLYERAHSELTLQQTKRDQIITLYLSIFSLLIPFAFSLELLSEFHKGLIFLAVGFIGIIFSVIVIRYRIYKEIYWLCCETITCMMNVKEDKLNKQMVQTLFYKSLKKKGLNYCKNGKWSSVKYFNKNIFSSETLHYIIIALLTSVLIGLGGTLVLPCELTVNIIIAVAASGIVFAGLIILYFYHCKEVYAVLKNGKDCAFNKSFGKAWFLHLYVDISDEK